MITEKKVLIGLTVLSAIAAIWFFSNRKTVMQNSIAPPNYLTFNNPRSKNFNGTSTGIPDVGPNPSSSDCGCGNGESGYLTTINNLIDYFNTGMKAAFNNYQQQTYDALPLVIRQYVDQGGSIDSPNTYYNSTFQLSN